MISKMSNNKIPIGWKVETIDDCCMILDSKRIPLNSYEREKIKGNIPYYGANGIQGFINKHIFNENLILLAEDGGNFGEYQNKPIAYLISGKSWVNNHAHVLKNKSDYNLKWIFYSIVHKNILSFIQGTTRSKLNQSDLKKIMINIPPLNEQQKIVSILSNVDNTLEKTNQIIQQIQLLKKGMIQRLFTKGIRHTKFKKIEWYFGKEFDIPEEWELMKMDNVCHKITDGTHQTPKYMISGNLFLSVKNVRANKLLLNSVKYISAEEHSQLTKRTKPEPLDILYTKVGTYGLAAVVEDISDFSIFVSLALLKPNKKLIDSYFLCELMNSPIIKSQADLMIKGISVPDLHLEDIKNFKIFLPSLLEQKRIASILSNINSQIHKEELYKSNLELLKKGLMQKLLTGKIQVKV